MRPTSAVVRLWWRNSAKQQTVISSQRQYTERRDLACPYDSKSKHTRTHTHSVLVHDPGEFKRRKKNLPQLPTITPHSSLISFRPLTLPSFSSSVLFPSTPQQSAQSSLSLITIHPSHPSLLPLPLDKQETLIQLLGDEWWQSDTQLNVCSHDKNKQNNPTPPPAIAPSPDH